MRTSMKRLGQASISAMTLLLAGCGDSGGGVASTPVPPASYTKIVDMTGNRAFQTAGVTYTTNASGISNGATNLYGSGVTINYAAASDSYTVTAPGGATQTFGPAELQPTDPSAPNVAQYVKVNGTTRDQLTFVATKIGGVPLSYTLAGTWGTIDTSNNTGTYRLAVGGSPTLTSDVPKAGTASYAIGIGGTAVETPPGSFPFAGTPYSLSGNSFGTFSANFASGTVQTSLTLAGTGGLSAVPGSPPPLKNFGSFTGTGTLTSGGPGFSGTLSGAITQAGGSFSGLFLGPQASEVGFGYVLEGPYFSAAGGVTGVKQ